MKFVDLKCPNCSGVLVKQDDSLICQSCGASFAIDYDESDVEYEKIKFQQIQSEREQLNKDNARGSKKFLVVIIVFLLLALGGPIAFIITQRSAMKAFDSIASSESAAEEKEPEIDYNVSVDDVKGMLGEFIESGRKVQMNISECAYWDQESALRDYDKTDAEFEAAYLVTNIPNVKPKQSNRLVIIYKVTWNNEDYGEQVCYDAVYFEGLSVNPNGGVISDFDGNTIMRSEAAWGWSMAYSFEELDQCYRENITALGGTVEQINQ